jgi:hypothetical protein
MREWLGSLRSDEIQAFAALANIMLTVGLLFFAGMQWWVTHRSERSRMAESSAAELAEKRRREREEDARYQLVWAEHFRLDSLADSWDDADLLELSLLGLLRPSDILTGEWSVLLQTLNQLSVEAGYLGGVARTMAYELERRVSEFNTTAQVLRETYAPLTVAQQARHVREAHGDQIAALEKGIKFAGRELALLIWDAVQHTPAATRDRTLTFSDNLMSSTAQSSVKALAKRAAKAVPSGSLSG